MESFIQDLRYAVRGLRKSPGFAAVALLTLALGIGANTAVFSIVDGVLIRRLPYADADRLVRVYEVRSGDAEQLLSVAHPTLDDWAASLPSYDGIALYGSASLDIVGDGGPEQLNGFMVSPAFFSVLRMTPATGRTFTREEQRPGGPKTIVLGDGLWRRRYAADRGVVGRAIRLNGEPFTVIGVMPRDSVYPAAAEFWISTANDAEYDRRDARHLSAIARLKQGVSVADATAEITTVEHRLAAVYPKNYQGLSVRLIPLQERMVGSVRPVLRVLFAAVAAILLIACANVANLLLARASRRQREVALRSALGASRARMAGQLIAEGVVLAVVGAALGVILALPLLDTLRVIAAADIPRLGDVALNGRVLAFTAIVALLTAGLVGVLPVMQFVAGNAHERLKEAGRSLSPGIPQQRARAALIVGQTAMALVLLSASGVLLRSVSQLTAVDPGVRTDRVLTFSVGLRGAREADARYAVAFFRELRQRLNAVPGVVEAAMASRLPLSGADHSSWVHRQGETFEPGRRPSAQDRAVTPGYFRTLGIPVRGREFTETDVPGGAPVVMINDAFARRSFRGEDALGQWIVPSRAGGVPRLIVGVAGDARQAGLDTPAKPEFYIPHAQDPWPWLDVIVHANVEPRSLVKQLEQAVWSLDASLPVTSIGTMDEMRDSSIAPRRLNMLLLGCFAGVALLLAAIGIYGVMAFIVAEREREVGIRLALGARPAEVRRMVVRRGLALAGLGAALGVAGWFASARMLESLVYGVAEADPLSLAGAIAVLGTAAFLACYLPARRASRVDPVVALRSE